MTALGPTLTSDRLVLHPPNKGDFDEFVALVGDPTAMAYIGGPQSRQVAWRTFTQMAGHWAIYGFGFFLVREREGGRMVGRVGTHQPEGWPGTEVVAEPILRSGGIGRTAVRLRRGCQAYSVVSLRHRRRSKRASVVDLSRPDRASAPQRPRASRTERL